MATKDPADEAREKIEAMQRANPGKGLVLTLTPKKAPMAATVEQQLQELKYKYERLKRIISNALVTLDILLKFGTPVALWFWPLPQDHWIQSIVLGSFLILLTIISKTITKVKTQD